MIQDLMPATLTERFRRAGELRDSFLVAGGAIYIIGYVVWSLFAMSIGLGPVTALDAQYFAVGLVAALLLGTVGGAFWYLRRAMLDKWSPYLWSLAPRRRLYASGALLVVIGVSIAISDLLMSRPPTSMGQFAGAFGALFVASVCISVAPSYLPRSILTTVALSFFALLALVFCVGVFIFLIYPAIPQEIGGGEPRDAYLDIQPAVYSQDTLNELGIVHASTPVARSRKVAVVVSTDRSILVFIGSGRLFHRERVELSREGVKAIHWAQ